MVYNVVSVILQSKMAKITELEELKAKAKNGKLTDEERRLMMSLMDDELDEFMR